MTASGRIFQINLSRGGVPKLAVAAGEVGLNGLAGDGVRNTAFHGGPERALCLYSLERILALQAEGHPIFPGAAGENLTLSGLDWELAVPGQRLKLGESVLVEITRYTKPCATIAPYFRDQNGQRIRQDEHPGWSRVYARVLQPGAIRPGNAAAWV